MSARRRSFALSLLCAAASSLAGCGSGMGDLGGGTAQVRFVAVAPGSPAVDFYINGSGAAYGLGYESFTSYLPVSTGLASVAVHRTGVGQALAATQETLASGHQYTVLLGRGAGSVQTKAYSDQEQPAPPGEAALRVVSAVESTAPVTFYVASVGANAATPPMAAFSLATGDASAYAPVSVGSYTLTATTGNGTLRLPVASVTVKARSGAVRTVIFAGTLNAENRKGVVGFVLADADLP